MSNEQDTVSLQELLERVEHASGPSDAIDNAIAHFVLGTLSPWDEPPTSRQSITPAYTSSLDAALALVEEKLPGRDWACGVDHENRRRCWAMLDDDVWDEAMEHIVGYGPNAPLALLAALLKCLISQQETSNV